MEEVWQAKLEVAWLAFRQGSEERAIDLAGEVLQEDPEHGEALFLMGCSQLRLGNFVAAERAVRGLLGLEPDEGRSHFLAGLYHQHATRDLVAAETAYRTAIRLAPDNQLHHCLLAQLLGEVGRVEEGITIAHNAIKMNPEDLPLLNTLQSLHRLNKDPELAERYGRQALAIEPEQAGPHFEMGLRLLESGSPNKARGSFRETLRLSPGDEGTREAIAHEQVRQHWFFKHGYFLPFTPGYVAAVAITPIFWWLLSLLFGPLVYVAVLALVIGVGAYLYLGLFRLCVWLAERRIGRGTL